MNKYKVVITKDHEGLWASMYKIQKSIFGFNHDIYVKYYGDKNYDAAIVRHEVEKWKRNLDIVVEDPDNLLDI